jgi:hypothetical protein
VPARQSLDYGLSWRAIRARRPTGQLTTAEALELIDQQPLM